MFAFFYLFTALESMGFPKRRGFLPPRQVVATEALDAAVNTLMRCGVVAGGLSPDSAARLLAEIFSDNPWTDASVDILLTGLNVQDDFEMVAPWDELGPETTADYGSFWPWASVKNAEFLQLVAGSFARCIIWSLHHPDATARALETDFIRSMKTVNEMAAWGIPIDASAMPATAGGWLATLDGLVAGYELTKRRSLGPIPPALARHPVIAARLAKSTASTAERAWGRVP